ALEAGLRLRPEVDLCARAQRELPVTGNEIRVEMCLDDVLDPKPFLGRLLDVDVDIAARVDDRCLPFGTDHVRRLREAAKIELFEKHVDVRRSEDYPSERRRQFRSPAIASPTIASLRRAMSDPPESPRSNTEAGPSLSRYSHSGGLSTIFRIPPRTSRVPLSRVLQRFAKGAQPG